MHAWPSRPPAHSALPIAPLAHCAPGTRGSAMPRELPEHWLTAASSTRGMASSSSSVSDNGRSTRPCTARRNRPTSISGRDDRPVPAHVVPVVWREHALVEHLERRLEQRRPGPLQDHRALVRKRRGDRPIAQPAGKGQPDLAPGSDRIGQHRGNERSFRYAAPGAAPVGMTAFFHIRMLCPSLHSCLSRMGGGASRRDVSRWTPARYWRRRSMWRHVRRRPGGRRRPSARRARWRRPVRRSP